MFILSLRFLFPYIFFFQDPNFIAEFLVHIPGFSYPFHWFSCPGPILNSSAYVNIFYRSSIILVENFEVWLFICFKVFELSNQRFHLLEMLAWFIMSHTSVNAFLTCSHGPIFYLYFLKGTSYWEDYFWICSLLDLARRKQAKTSVLISKHIRNINVLKINYNQQSHHYKTEMAKNNYEYTIKLKII